MRWAGHGALIWERCWWENLKESDYLDDPDVGGRIILRWIFRKWVVRTWTGSICFSIGTDGGHM
jgi:hypothetical protein